MQKDNILNIGNNPITVVDLALHIKSSGNFYPNRCGVKRKIINENSN